MPETIKIQVSLPVYQDYEVLFRGVVYDTVVIEYYDQGLAVYDTKAGEFVGFSSQEFGRTMYEYATFLKNQTKLVASVWNYDLDSLYVMEHVTVSALDEEGDGHSFVYTNAYRDYAGKWWYRSQSGKSFPIGETVYAYARVDAPAPHLPAPDKANS